MADNIKDIGKLTKDKEEGKKATVKDEMDAEADDEAEEEEDANEKRKKDVKEMIEGSAVFDSWTSSEDEEPGVRAEEEQTVGVIRFTSFHHSLLITSV